MKNLVATYVAVVLFSAFASTLMSSGCAPAPEPNGSFHPRTTVIATSDNDAGLEYEPDAGSGKPCASPFDVVFKSKSCGELQLSKFSKCRTISAPSGCITTAEYECQSPCHSSIWMEWNGEHGQVIEASACSAEDTSVCVYTK